jgi:hypothetical protein
MKARLAGQGAAVGEVLPVALRSGIVGRKMSKRCKASVTRGLDQGASRRGDRLWPGRCSEAGQTKEGSTPAVTCHPGNAQSKGPGAVTGARDRYAPAHSWNMSPEANAPVSDSPM